MKILYVCDFNLRRHAGKDRATRQKLAGLGALTDLTVISASSENELMKVIEIVWIEIRAILLLLRNKQDVVISRGYVGWLFQPLARFVGVKSVREVHSDALGEAELLPYKGYKLWVIRKLAYISHAVDRRADMRIFNHPDLKAWYADHVLPCRADKYVYNGYDPAAGSIITHQEALKKFSLSDDFKYLVFVGGASKWHGVEYLVSLQAEFDKNNDGLKIVCGGGDISKYDPQGRCINITPLDERGCADLIKAGTLCLLPVMANRISPGSPLKLYDYICNKRYVVAPCAVNGYSDEVRNLGVGCCVDYSNSAQARVDILGFMQAYDLLDESRYPTCPVTWSDRMGEWLDGLAKL